MRRLKAPERRKQLVEVATRLFAERGFDATTTAAIAAAAGVSEPILYRHFKSKQDMFVAIVTEVSRTTQDHWRELMAHVRDPAEAFRVICAEWPEHMRRCQREYAVIHNAIVTSRDPEVVGVLRRHYAQMEAFWTQVLKDGQASGLFDLSDDVRTTVWWILNAGIGYTLIHLQLGPVDGYSVPKAINLTLKALGVDEKRLSMPLPDIIGGVDGRVPPVN